MCREVGRWEELIQRFKITFTFEHESSSIDVALQAIQTKIFLEEETMELILVCNEHINNMIVRKLLECYNISKEECDEEDPGNVQIPKIEGEQAIEGSKLESTVYTQSINTRKVNIRTTENPKFV
jgi:hypothetical protein